MARFKRPRGMLFDFLTFGAVVFGQFRLSAAAALIAGILILVAPRLLSYIVAIYLILIGIMGLTGATF